MALGKLVTKKPVVFVVFDNRVEFDKKRQVNDNRVEFDKFTFCRIRQKKVCHSNSNDKFNNFFQI